MTQSMNEVEALAKRATRGARYSWGMSEEASKATRWACENGFDGLGLLASLLVKTDGQVASEVAPKLSEGVWASASGPLCPLLAGVAISDQMGLADVVDADLKDVMFPALVLPFLAKTKRDLRIVWENVEISLGPSGRRFNGDENALSVPQVAMLHLEAGTVEGTLLKPATRAHPRAQDLEILNQFAGRTYAPATEASRLLGAGAGETDND